MTEAEWLACDNPSTMVVSMRGKASDRTFFLLALACTRRMLTLVPEKVVAFAAFDQAADEPEPRIAMLRVTEQHPGHWGVDDEPWDFAEFCARGPRSELGQIHGPPLIRDIFGNPFRPVALESEWRTSTVLALAQGIYDERAFDRMPILADALQDAGCENDDILTHCRGPGQSASMGAFPPCNPHVRGCWVVDLILGKS